MKTTSNRPNQPKSTKPNRPNQTNHTKTSKPNRAKTKPNLSSQQNGIHETNWQIQTMLVDQIEQGCN